MRSWNNFLRIYDTNLIAIEALSNSITRYEAEAESFSELYQHIGSRDPAVATLKVLMDQYGLDTTYFENEIGDNSMVSQILNSEKCLTGGHIEHLADRFGKSPALFF